MKAPKSQAPAEMWAEKAGADAECNNCTALPSMGRACP